MPALAAALGVSTDELLGSRSPQDPRVRSEPAAARGHDAVAPQRTRAPAPGCTPSRPRSGADRSTPPERLPVHEGNDWIYVLEGRLRLVLGDHEHVIEAGEAVEFSTWTPHWFGALDGPVQLLLIVGPQGERLHLHA